MNLLLWCALALGADPTFDDPTDARPRRSWDIEHLHLDVRVDPGSRDVRGTVTHTIQPYGLPASHIRFHQVGLDISEVKVDGEPTDSWRLGPTTLDVPVSGHTPHTVEITYSARPEKGVHFRSPQAATAGITEIWTQGEDEDHRHWFPSWDHPSDRFRVSMDLTVPAHLHAVANGVLQGSSTPEPGWKTWSYTMDEDMVNYLVAFAAGEYAVFTDEGDVPFEYIVPEGTSEQAARYGFGDAPRMTAYLGELLDEPFPYPIYRQVMVQRFMYGGMENSSITITALGSLTDEHDLPDDGAHGLTAHELAHQWFGDLLTCHGWRELWLNEGFATFYAGRISEHFFGPEVYAAKVKGWARSRDTTRPVAARGWSKVDERPNTSVYSRGAMVLHMLRVWLGDARYDAAIAAYIDAHRHGLVETGDLRRHVEQAAGMNLDWFFDRWIHGWGAPSFETSHRWSEEQLTVTIRQTGDGPAWRGPVEIAWAGEDDAAEHRQTVWLSEGTTTLQVPLKGGTKWVSVDPRDGLLAHWTHNQPTKAWAAQLAAASDAGARLTAIDALGEATSDVDVAVAALTAAMNGAHRISTRKDDTQHMERAAARALADLGADAARDALLDAQTWADASPSLRDTITQSLGSFSLDERVQRRLEEILADRGLYAELRASALSSLASVRASAVASPARALLRRPDPTRSGVLMSAALDALAEHGTLSDLRSIRRLLGDPRRSVQHSAGNAAVRIATLHGDDADQASLVPALAAWLSHEDIRTRSMAIYYLEALGHEGAKGPLRRFASTTQLEEHAVRARNAAHSISRSSAAPESPDALAEALTRLERLEEELKEAKERIKDLETW